MESGAVINQSNSCQNISTSLRNEEKSLPSQMKNFRITIFSVKRHKSDPAHSNLRQNVLISWSFPKTHLIIKLRKIDFQMSLRFHSHLDNDDPNTLRRRYRYDHLFIKRYRSFRCFPWMLSTWNKVLAIVSQSFKSQFQLPSLSTTHTRGLSSAVLLYLAGNVCCPTCPKCFAK